MSISTETIFSILEFTEYSSVPIQLNKNFREVEQNYRNNSRIETWIPIGFKKLKINIYMRGNYLTCL